MNEPIEMTVDECWTLLRSGIMGRVAMATPVGPRIVPLNYAVHADNVVFRTSAFSELATYGWNTDLAFEIDHIDHEKHKGWSVIAIGRGSRIEDPDELRTIQEGWDPTPWAAGQRHLYIRLVVRDITGRRLGHDWTPSTMAPVRRAL